MARISPEMHLGNNFLPGQFSQKNPAPAHFIFHPSRNVLPFGPIQGYSHHRHRGVRMKIRIILPVANSQFNSAVATAVDTVKAPDCHISIVNLNQGPNTIESRWDTYLAGPEIIRACQDAQRDGIDGIFIDCFGDPLVPVAREAVDIPVIGGFGAALTTAAMIAQRYTIISVSQNVVAMNRALVREMGMENNLVSMPVVNMPVGSLSDTDTLMNRLMDVSANAVRNDGAQAIILGCTGMLGVAKPLEKALQAQGIPAPVIDPTTTAMTMLQGLIRNGLSQSRLTYPPCSQFPSGNG